MKVLNIVGARPNFMKVAPLHRLFVRHGDILSKIIHTGQHYDEGMSDIFFRQLDLPKPDYFLGIGGRSQTMQTANCMLAFEKVLIEEAPDLVVVVGDVNSTVACAMVAVKEHVPVVHIEAGLRSGDRSMPEEINRIITDSLSDHLFVTEQSGVDNLRKENIPDERIHFTGNVMIDSLIHSRSSCNGLNVLQQWKLAAKSYFLFTMHRPSNVDTLKGLENIIQIVKVAAELGKVVFPMHPRTLKNMNNFGLTIRLQSISNVILISPQGYFEFICLTEHALAVVTDSGGIQEETTFLGIPCITLRNSTERPITVRTGTNFLIGNLDPFAVGTRLKKILCGDVEKGEIPPFWDGHAAERIVEILIKTYSH